jgi:hypothetical protein
MQDANQMQLNVIEAGSDGYAPRSMLVMPVSVYQRQPAALTLLQREPDPTLARTAAR